MWFRAKAKNSKKWIQKENPFWAVARYLFWLAHIHAVKLPSTLLDPTNYLILCQIGDQPSVWTWARWKLRIALSVVARSQRSINVPETDQRVFDMPKKFFYLLFLPPLQPLQPIIPKWWTMARINFFTKKHFSKYSRKPKNLAEILLTEIDLNWPKKINQTNVWQFYF